MRIKLSSAVINNIQREKLFQSIQDKNLLKSKVGCFWHFSYVCMINQFLHISLSHINPNKTGLFEGSFFGRGGDEFSYFEKNLSNINITLNNCETIYWKYVESAKMLTLSDISWGHQFLCNKEMPKNPKIWWKSIKIANIDRQMFQNFWTTWGIYMKFWYMIILKVTKKPRFSTSV